MSYRSACKISEKSDKRFKSYRRLIMKFHLFAAKVKWSVFKQCAVYRNWYGVSRLKLLCMLIGMLSNFGINFEKKYALV